MKYGISMLLLFILSMFNSSSHAAFFLPDPNLGIGNYRQPDLNDAVKSLSIHNPHVHISNRVPVRVVILYDISKGEEIKSLRLFENKTHLPLHYFGISDGFEVKEDYRLNWFLKLKKFALDALLCGEAAITNQNIAEQYLFVNERNSDITLDLCVELKLASGEVASTCGKKVGDR